jgi:hypothetical protein
MRRLRVALLVACAGLVSVARAQDARLTTRLDDRTTAAVARIVDSARAAKLPTEPLVAKALEGASKGASGERIVSAVRAYAGALGTARDALGGASEEEIVAGAGAILSGVAPDALRRLRSVRRGQSLTLPLVVMADLVARGVPADTAAGAIYLAARAGARDAELLSLRQIVEQDIQAGAAPAAAVALRVRNLPGAETLDMFDAPRPGAAPEDSLSRSPP